MSDRHAWLHMPQTQELLAWLDYSHSELGKLFTTGSFVSETVDQTAMAHLEIVGRCKVLAAVSEVVKAGVPSEEKEYEEPTPDVTDEEYGDA